MQKPALAALLQAPFVMTIDGTSVSSPKTSGVINPATEEVIAQCPDATEAQLDAAVRGAREAFASWSRTSFEQRRRVMRSMADRIAAEARELGGLITAEQGKPLATAITECETMGPGSLRGFSAMELPSEVLIDDDARRVELHRRPLGVVGAIVAWNYPVHTALQKIAPAIYAGNTVIMKPSPFTPLATLRMMERLRDLRPPGVVQTLSGGDEMGRWISEHPGIDKISFTGSTPTGRRIMASSAESLKHLTLELGGNDAGIVLPDADVEAAAPMIAQSAFNNCGQVCHALKRLFVHRSQYAEMCEALVRAVSDMPVGDGMQESTRVGPLANRMQFELICRLVGEARERGARILCGGEALDGPGYFYPPTIVADVEEGTALVDEEQFGPALPVLSYGTVDEAVGRANASDKGLSGSVWTADIEEGARVAARLECGTAWINQHSSQPTANHVSIPFGGFKASGVGRERGLLGLLAYTQTQVINLRK
ncbi:MAG: aldehyde dehydrogenase family protein [Myxococcota bacterium]|nr:aldehyde dehydrogenase family protein [Myxococcota bacterium]